MELVPNTGFFAGKTVLISGASRGIGLAFAKKLGADGAKVIILAKSVRENPKLPGTIFSAAREVEKAGGQCLPISCDIRDEKAVKDAITKAMQVFGPVIDVLINNASAISLADTEQTDMKRFDLMQGVNVRGTYLLTKMCLPYLKAGANPHVLNICPPLCMQQQWFEHHAAYTISKYGMSMCTLGMSGEFRKHGIAVNSLWPRKCVWTAAVAMLKRQEKEAIRQCRKVEIMSDAAYLLLQQPSAAVSGQFLMDEEVLTRSGLSDLSSYAFDPNAELTDDLYIPGLSYDGPSDWGISTFDNPLSAKQQMERAKL